MSNKDIIMEALNYGQPQRVPWVPYVGVHGAKLLGKSAQELLQSSELLYQSFSKSREIYDPDALPIAFDLQLEAEAIGCQLTWAEDNPPAVTSHILSEVPLSELKVPTEQDGRIPLFLETTTRLVQDYGKDIGVMGLICGPFTLGLHLAGSKMITQMIRNPGEVKDILSYTSRVAANMAAMYLERGVEIIAIVDPMTSQIKPEHFDNFVVPSLEETLAVCRKHNAYSLIFVCGNATRIIPNLARVNATGFAVDENVDLAYCAQEARKEKKVLAGNLPLTVGLLFGEVEENIGFAKDCIEKANGPGFILAPG